jgi:hypothetical protein
MILLFLVLTNYIYLSSFWYSHPRAEPGKSKEGKVKTCLDKAVLGTEQRDQPDLTLKNTKHSQIIESIILSFSSSHQHLISTYPILFETQ